jgi:hypothetical protein
MLDGGWPHRRIKWLGGTALTFVVAAGLLWRREGAPSPTGNDGGARRAGEPAAHLSVARAPHVSATKIPSFRLQPGLAQPGLAPAPEQPVPLHAQAIHLKDRARAEGSRVPPSAELFDGDQRDPGWAPAMERALQERLRQAQETLANVGLSGVRLKAPDCRTSTCRLELEYTSADLATAGASGNLVPGEEPFGFLMRQTGPFSSSSSDLRAEPTKVVDGVTHYRQLLYLLFGEQESDPERYATWVAETLRRHAEYRRTHGSAERR